MKKIKELKEDEISEIKKRLRTLSAKHGGWEAFTDVVACMAYAISNAVDMVHYKDREEDYLRIIKGYDEKERMLFPEIFQLLQAAIQRNFEFGKIQDILGPVYMDLGIADKGHGQFFTPQSICDLMGDLCIKGLKPDETTGILTIHEPSCGAGATTLSGIQSARQNGVDLSKIFIKAQDISDGCVKMTYVQLSLYGVPAVVTHGDTLTLEEWTNWYTPAYMMGQWFWRDSCITGKKQRADVELFRRASDPVYRAIREMEEMGRDAVS